MQIRGKYNHAPFRAPFGMPATSANGMADSVVGVQKKWRGLFFGSKLQVNRGYSYDLNGNGRYDAGRDAVLVFDVNRDGRFSKKEVEHTNRMMKAAMGNYDLDGNGKVSFMERAMGKAYRKHFGSLDRNRDGRLSSSEISRGGGALWVDKSRDGKIGRSELRSPFHRVYNGGRPQWPGCGCGAWGK